jgi:hypothetical protein
MGTWKGHYDQRRIATMASPPLTAWAHLTKVASADINADFPRRRTYCGLDLYSHGIVS